VKSFVGKSGMNEDDAWLDGLRKGLREIRAEAASPPRYEKLAKIGEGATAVVYRAWDRELKRAVALKILRPLPEVWEVAMRRLQREAEAMASLAHPNIVTLYDAVITPGTIELVMELVEGAPLSRILGERKVEMRTLVRLLEKAARGVASAHAKGIVHRDLKPANILVDSRGEPRVGDFGLAHFGGSRTAMTETGAILGTPLYMAPEQIAGGSDSVTPRTDVYGLGAILYEIATGRPPHAADTMEALLHRILHDLPIPPRKLNPSATRDLETVILKSLEKDPTRRYADAGDLADDLDRTLRGEPVRARRAGPAALAWRWAKRHRAVTAATLVFALAAGAATAILTVNRHRLRSRIVELQFQAAEAERQERWDEARDRHAEVRLLSPGQPLSEGKFYTLAEKAKAAERRRRSRALLEQARRVREQGEEIAKELERVKEQKKELETTIRPWDPRDRQLVQWKVEDRQEELENLQDVKRQEELRAYLSAYGADPEDPKPRSLLAQHYFKAFCLASRDVLFDDPEEFAASVRMYDDGTLEPELHQDGALSFDSSPTGAELYLFRYEEGGDPRLLPRPFNAIRRESRRPARESDEETLYALECSDFNRIGTCPVAGLKLARGSYLAVLRRAGFRDTRFPVFVRRGDVTSVRVPLYSDETIGRGFLYVPGGEYLTGMRYYRERAGGAKIETARADGFFLSKFEVTCDEYREFIAAVARTDPAAARRRVPRDAEKNQTLWRVDDDGTVRYWSEGMKGTWPVSGISWDDAQAYCEWRTAQARAQGERVRFRLPTSVEWERAGRGADCRMTPWGQSFVWCFAKGALTRNQGSPEPVGTFPEDESPFGVRDICGSVSEWCADERPGKWQDRIARGGSYAFANASQFLWYSFSLNHGRANIAVGIRLVRVVE